MKIFVDANILVSILNKEYPLFTYSSRIISLAEQEGIEVFTSPICLAIAFYFAEKKSGSKKAKEKIKLLSDHLGIAEATADGLKKAVNNPAIIDFEDGLEYYAALESKCRCIITEDPGDFHFSNIEVLNSEAFFKQHLLK
ncbi:MAG: PIN domain-containing protein [Bacteroidetes bacterium]|nr:PIN domain-containing protein [Bacteroidota bacterium]